MKTNFSGTETKFPFFKNMREVTPNLFKRLIFNLPFVKNAILEAEIKAFPKAQKDVLETMADDIDAKAQVLADTKLASLLSNVDLRKIVTIDKERGIAYIGGIKADENKLANLKAEAKFLLESDIWQLIQETPKELAQRAMFLEGDNMEAQHKKGRAILYTLSAQRNIVDIFNSYEPKPMKK